QTVHRCDRRAPPTRWRAGLPILRQSGPRRTERFAQMSSVRISTGKRLVLQRRKLMRLSSLPLCLLAWFAVTGSPPQDTEVYGNWSAAFNVGPPVNTADYNDTYAILSRDELTMSFTSDRPGGAGGDDLWFTTRASLDHPC